MDHLGGEVDVVGVYGLPSLLIVIVGIWLLILYS